MHITSIAAQQVTWRKRAASGSWGRAAAPASYSAACSTRCRTWNQTLSPMHRVRGWTQTHRTCHSPPVCCITSACLCASRTVWSEVVHGVKLHPASFQDCGRFPCFSRQLALVGQPAAGRWSDVWGGVGGQLMGGDSSTLFRWVSCSCVTYSFYCIKSCGLYLAF